MQGTCSATSSAWAHDARARQLLRTEALPGALPLGPRWLMRSLARLLREPLLHFLLAGALLFALAGALGPGRSNEDGIVVDRAALLSFIEYRAGTYDPEGFAAVLDAMSDQEVRRMIADYVTEEMLYREARARDLAESDRVIRQRLVQRMRTLLSERANAEPTEDALATYFATHAADYTIAPTVTFTHLFFDAGRHGEAEARAAAVALQQQLRASGSNTDPPEAAGDWFPYFRNYVERTPDYVAGHFGQQFTTELLTLGPDAAQWQGPLRSGYGWHLVRLTSRNEERPATLDEVRDAVAADYARFRADAEFAAELERLRQRYHVSIDSVRPAFTP